MALLVSNSIVESSIAYRMAGGTGRMSHFNFITSQYTVNLIV